MATVIRSVRDPDRSLFAPRRGPSGRWNCQKFHEKYEDDIWWDLKTGYRVSGVGTSLSSIEIVTPIRVTLLNPQVLEGDYYDFYQDTLLLAVRGAVTAAPSQSISLIHARTGSGKSGFWVGASIGALPTLVSGPRFVESEMGVSAWRS